MNTDTLETGTFARYRFRCVSVEKTENKRRGDHLKVATPDPPPPFVYRTIFGKVNANGYVNEDGGGLITESHDDLYLPGRDYYIHVTPAE